MRPSLVLLLALAAPPSAVAQPSTEADPAAGGAAVVVVEEESTDTEDDADEWRPHRIGVGGGALFAAWSRDDGEATFLWEASDGMGVVVVDYRFLLGPWLGFGASFSTQLASTVIAAVPTGFAVSVGARVYLWPDWVYLQLDGLFGYPALFGVLGGAGLTIPVGQGIYVRLESQFWYNRLEDGLDFAVGWLPGFGLEASF